MRLKRNERALSSIKALFKAENIDFNDVESCMKSLSQTCLPSALTKIYLDSLIYGDA